MLWFWNFSATSSCKLLENLIFFSLITSSIECAFFLTSYLLPCIFPPYTLFFLTNRNMTVEVENKGPCSWLPWSWMPLLDNVE
jgi:hypothetical protein